MKIYHDAMDAEREDLMARIIALESKSVFKTADRHEKKFARIVDRKTCQQSVGK